MATRQKDDREKEKKDKERRGRRSRGRSRDRDRRRRRSRTRSRAPASAPDNAAALAPKEAAEHERDPRDPRKDSLRAKLSLRAEVEDRSEGTGAAGSSDADSEASESEAGTKEADESIDEPVEVDDDEEEKTEKTAKQAARPKSPPGPPPKGAGKTPPTGKSGKVRAAAKSPTVDCPICWRKVGGGVSGMAQHQACAFHLTWKRYRAMPESSADWDRAVELGEAEATRLWHAHGRGDASGQAALPDAPAAETTPPNQKTRVPAKAKKGAKKKSQKKLLPVPHADRPGKVGDERRPPSPDPEGDSGTSGLVRAMWQDALAALTRAR